MTAEEVVSLIAQYLADHPQVSAAEESLETISAVLLQFYALFELAFFCLLVVFTVKFLWWFFNCVIFKGC
jgi:hypothetical protein